MTDKHNFTFRVRVQGLKGQLQRHSSKSYLGKSISHNTKNRRFLWITFPFLWLRIQILQQFFYKDPGSGAILTHKTCHR